MVIIKNADIKASRKNPVTTAPNAAIMLYYIADNEEHEDIIKLIRLTLDVAAILSAVYSGGATPLLIRTLEAGIAITDIAMMDDGIRDFLKENGFGWFVENWDTIYLMIGMGFISSFIVKGIIARGPALIEFFKNAKNVPKNWNVFKKDLELLVKEASAYEAKQTAKLIAEGGQEIEAIVLNGNNYGLLRKLLNLAHSPETYVKKVIQDLTVKGLSVRKVRGLYEVLYNGKPFFKGEDLKVGQFLKKMFWQNSKQVAKELAKLLPKEYKLSNEGRLLLKEWADNATKQLNVKKYDKKLRKFTYAPQDVYSKNTRPAAVSLLEGRLEGQIKRIFAYSGKGIANELPKGLHPLVKQWLKNAPEFLRSRGAHGKCAEPAAISKFLWEIDPNGTMTIEQAKNVFESFTSHAIQIEGKNVKAVEHGVFKSAYASCNPLLEYFNISIQTKIY